MNRDIHAIEPPLLADAAALDAYLGTYPNLYAERNYPAISLDSWLALGEGAGEPAYATARRLGLPLVRLEHISAESDALALVPPDLARRLRAIPLRVCNGMVAVAMEDPGGPDAQRLLDFLSRERVLPLVASPLQIREAIARHYDQVEDHAMARQLGIDASIVDEQSPSEQEAQRLAVEMPVVSMVYTLIADAVARRASDIHLRPGEDATDVLYRIDDELVPVRRLARALNPAVVSRIKVLAGMNLAEHRRPQDGRTTFRLGDRQTVDLRISLMPTVFGESIVVRLLDTSESLWNLDQLGLSQCDRQRIDDVMARSHGMFLATGPTGCGKSTTLYAMLLELRKQRINILTIEDPVEFHIADIQQMQVNRAAGFTFASAMRNFLRHDPDVIMVGEIRDRETADIAVESALTGHLMLSTLHTNTAATTITRLLDLGVEAYLLRTSLLGGDLATAGAPDLSALPNRGSGRAACARRTRRRRGRSVPCRSRLPPLRRSWHVPPPGRLRADGDHAAHAPADRARCRCRRTARSGSRRRHGSAYPGRRRPGAQRRDLAGRSMARSIGLSLAWRLCTGPLGSTRGPPFRRRRRVILRPVKPDPDRPGHRLKLSLAMVR